MSRNKTRAMSLVCRMDNLLDDIVDIVTQVDGEN